MGASNAMQVYFHWPKLITHRESAALTYMALMSLDGDEPPRFFAEWKALASAIGIDPEGNEELARRNTLKVLSGLKRAGAIVPSGQARTGVRAEYALALDPKYTFRPVGAGREVEWERVARPETCVSKTDTQVDQESSGQRVQNGHPSVSKTDRPACPKRTDLRVQNGPDSVSKTDTPRRSSGGVQEQVQEKYQEGGGLENLSTVRASTNFSPPLPKFEDETELDERARTVLSALPDFGAAKLAQVRATDPALTPRQERIRAAELHSSVQPHSPPSPSREDHVRFEGKERQVQ